MKYYRIIYRSKFCVIYCTVALGGLVFKLRMNTGFLSVVQKIDDNLQCYKCFNRVFATSCTFCFMIKIRILCYVYVFLIFSDADFYLLLHTDDFYY